MIRRVLKNLEAAAAQRRSTSVAGIGAVVVVMVVLSGFAWWSISDAGQAGDQMRVEAAVGARYEQAATALARLQAAAAGYTLRPTHDSQSDLTHSQLSMDAAVEHIGPAAADATDARTVARLSRMDGVLDSGIERLRAAIMRGDAAQVVTIESKGVRQPIVAIRTLITQSIGRHNQRTAASLASSRAAGMRMKVVAIITGLLGTVVVLASLRMVLLRRRLAEAHTREVELLRSALVHDNLTGLRNHRGFLDDLGAATSRETACALLVLDLDDLRSVNDSQGHTAGDQLLVKLAGAMQAVAPDGATAYRVGGDEFAILTTRPLSPQVIADHVATACSRVASPRPTATTGYAYWSPGMTAEELTRRADVALREARRRGVSGLPYSPQLDANRSCDETDRRELRELLERPDAITPVFQPIFDLRSFDVVGYEALTRFPADCARTTQEWFDLAHRHGLGAELEAAAAKAALAQPGRPTGASLSLNVSPDVLLNGRDCLGLPDDLTHITIEVTEDALVTEGVELERALLDLRARGARIAVDDAGAGYAGFAQLVRVRPDVIKLDRSLIENVNTDPTKAAVVKAFVGYAGDTGALICAEGIETPGELHCVARLGVATAQGFLLGRPAQQWSHGPADPRIAKAVEARVVSLRAAS